MLVLRRPLHYCRVPKNVLPQNGQTEFPDFLGTRQARNSKIRMVGIIVHKMCTNLALCTALKRAALIAGKNVNWLESEKLRAAPGYDAELHVLWHLTVLYVS